MPNSTGSPLSHMDTEHEDDDISLSALVEGRVPEVATVLEVILKSNYSHTQLTELLQGIQAAILHLIPSTDPAAMNFTTGVQLKRGRPEDYEAPEQQAFQQTNKRGRAINLGNMPGTSRQNTPYLKEMTPAKIIQPKPPII